MSGFGPITLFGVVVATVAGTAGLHAQTQLADPRDAQKIFASTCSACHKSPQGLAKSGQVAGFLRQHYTTGPEMSAAMAAYLVAAGSPPASRKGQATAENPGTKSKGRKQEQAAATPADPADEAKGRPLRKQRQTKSHDEPATTRPAHPAAPEPATPQHAAPEPAIPQQAAPEPAARQAAAPAAPASNETPAAPAVSVAPPAEPAGPPPVVFDVPLPAMPERPPPELTHSAFSSSPLP